MTRKSSNNARPTREEAIAALANPEVQVDENLDGFLGPDASGADEFADEDVSRIRDVSRAGDTREAEAREPATWLPRASLPDPNPEPGWRFRWIRVGFGKGADDVSNVMARMREGWVIVRPSEQPEIARTLANGGQGQDRILVGDNVLMKMPESVVEQRRAYYSRQSKQQAAGVQSQLLKLQDARMPLLRPSIVSTTSKRIEG